MATREDVERATVEAGAAYREAALASWRDRIEAAGRRVKVLDTWAGAVAYAYTRATQTGWKHTVRRVPLTDAYRVDRTSERVRHRRCNPARERETGGHAS